MAEQGLKQVGLRSDLWETLWDLTGDRIKFTKKNQSLSDTLEWILTTWKRPINDGSQHNHSE